MGETKYLSIATVIALHHDVMLETDSSPTPLLRPELLESALSKPHSAAFYEDADLIRQATLLAVGISQSQAFVEGNKRTAYVAADLFLRLNGLVYDGDPMLLAERLVWVAEANRENRDAAIDQFEACLRWSIEKS